MKKVPTSSNSKATQVKGNVKDEKLDNIHKVRKKIEHILLEREQKKLWDL